MHVSFGSPEDIVFLEELPNGNQATIKRVRTPDGTVHHQVGAWCQKCGEAKVWDESFENKYDDARESIRKYMSNHGDLGLHTK